MILEWQTQFSHLQIYYYRFNYQRFLSNLSFKFEHFDQIEDSLVKKNLPIGASVHYIHYFENHFYHLIHFYRSLKFFEMIFINLKLHFSLINHFYLLMNPPLKIHSL